MCPRRALLSLCVCSVLRARALLRTALEVCFALQHLHSRSVVHGALRPANVLLKSSNLDRRGFTVKVRGVAQATM